MCFWVLLSLCFLHSLLITSTCENQVPGMIEVDRAEYQTGSKSFSYDMGFTYLPS